MLDQLSKYYHTLKHTRPIQIWYRIKRIIIKPRIKSFPGSFPSNFPDEQIGLQLSPSISSHKSWITDNHFRFLNLEHRFGQKIDWNYPQYGKLWTYNLCYFEYLCQDGFSKQKGLELIRDFIIQEKTIKDGLESFPTALRIIFWIKFLVAHQISDDTINRFLYRQVRMLSAAPEYHLLGNHLLENGFSLLFGGAYFRDKKIIQQATSILKKELEEQILSDGAHFELSPMYHSILLYRILDCINLTNNNPGVFSRDSNILLTQKAEMQLAWLRNIKFNDDSLPQLNDCAPDIAPSVKALFNYAERLQIKPVEIALGDSGYRKFMGTNYEALIDVGNIGPDYIPGHAHSDTLNILIHHQGTALLVDTGTSTYEKNQTRQQERSTAAHNTVMVDDKEQSEIWSGFRVARRAKITKLNIEGHKTTASHDGYQHLGISHERTFLFEDKKITIEDKVIGGKSAVAFFHFHPKRAIRKEDNTIKGDFGFLAFDRAQKISLETYSFAEGFNRTKKASRLAITFKNQLTTTIALT